MKSLLTSCVTFVPHGGHDHGKAAAAALILALLTGCTAARLNNADLSQTEASAASGQRQQALTEIAALIDTKLGGRGPAACKARTFAFDEPRTGYEVDAFELHPQFLGKALNESTKCTDTRERRPPVILSSQLAGAEGILPADKAERLLAALGVGKPAAPGEVIVANVFHEKRFWIARIPTKGLTKDQVIFQLERFAVLAQEEIDFQSLPDFLNFLEDTTNDAKDWANRNIAGHTQLRLDFPKDKVQLTEQVIKVGQKPASRTIEHLVLSSEAQGVPGQSYSPVAAINPLFFSINRITSLDEKYTDMVVRQKNEVNQWRVNGTEGPQPAALLAFYLGTMARQNWQAMAANTEKGQEKAVYRTADWRPPGANRTRNCTTEVVTALEGPTKVGLLARLRARSQDLTLQRLYPPLLGRALTKSGFVSGDAAKLPDMDRRNKDSGRFEDTDPSLNALRARLSSDLELCQRYLAPVDRAQCKPWADALKANR